MNVALNKRFILGIGASLFFAVLVCFGFLHFVSAKLSSASLFIVLLAVSTPCVLRFSFGVPLQSMLHPSLRRQKTPELPLKSEDEIFGDLRKDQEPGLNDLNGNKVSHGGPLIPEVVDPTAIVPFQKPSEAIKSVMQQKVIEALQKCKVDVNISAEMSLDGEFKDPRISVSFVTVNPSPEASREKKPVDPLKEVRPESEEKEKLTRLRP